MAASGHRTAGTTLPERNAFSAPMLLGVSKDQTELRMTACRHAPRDHERSRAEHAPRPAPPSSLRPSPWCPDFHLGCSQLPGGHGWVWGEGRDDHR